MQRELEKLPDKVLIKYHNNALYTYYYCGVPTEESLNIQLIVPYVNEMARRKIEFPTMDEIFETGNYQGPGSASDPTIIKFQLKRTK